MSDCTISCPHCAGTGVSQIRRSIMAPPGHKIVVRDLSAIEARMNAWLAGQWDMIEVFANNQDVYCDMAGAIFSRIITKKQKGERFVGKAVTLGCGYGLGWFKFQGMIRVGMLGDSGRIFGQDIADSLGVSIPGFLARKAANGRTNEMIVAESCPPNIHFDVHACHCACAFAIINTFRNNKPEIPKLWETCNDALDKIYRGEIITIGTDGVIETRPEGFLLPNGMLIRYVELHQKPRRRGFDYSILKNRRKGEREKIYGGKCVENLVQALSRIVITDAMLKLKDEGVKVVHQVHDEIIAVAPEAKAEGVYHRMGEIMAAQLPWAPDLPLASEGGWADRYEK